MLQPIMLEGTSSGGNFRVQISWTSNDIGAENTFDVRLFDAASENELPPDTTTFTLYHAIQRRPAFRRNPERRPDSCTVVDIYIG
jgi:hypothetical protein